MREEGVLWAGGDGRNSVSAGGRCLRPRKACAHLSPPPHAPRGGPASDVEDPPRGHILPRLVVEARMAAQRGRHVRIQNGCPTIKPGRQCQCSW